MSKIKILNCASCGCDRKVLIKPTITKQDGETKFVMEWSRTCIPCFIKYVLNSDIGMDIKLDETSKPKAIECVGDNDE